MTSPARDFFWRDRTPIDLEWMRCDDTRLRSLPRPAVLVNGVFDLLHAGHMKLLYAAREKAGPDGTVVVAMDSDSRVRALKGDGRPIQSWIERATALQYMPIDALVEFDSKRQLYVLVRNLRPDLRVQGADHTIDIDKLNVPRMLVRASGPRTSDLIERIVKLYGQH